MTSIVDIAREALQIVSDKTIVSLDENSNAARQSRIAYPKARDTVLRAYAWTCATRRVSLPSSANGASFGDWSRFTRPADDIKLLPITDTGEEDGTPVPYRLEGRDILTNLDAPLKYRYITSNIDPVAMTPDLRSAIAAQMAVRLAEIINGSQSSLQRALGRYRMALADAKRADTEESQAHGVVTGSWWSARS